MAQVISGYHHLCIFFRYFVALCNIELPLDPRTDLANGQLQHHTSIFPFEWQFAVDARRESSCYQPVRLVHDYCLISFYAYSNASRDAPVTAFSIKLGKITRTSAPIVLALGFVRDPVIRSLKNGGIESRSSFFWMAYKNIGLAVFIHFFSLNIPN